MLLMWISPTVACFSYSHGSSRLGNPISTDCRPGHIWLGWWMLGEAVHEGDKVTVSYHDMGGTMHASNVRVTAAMKK